MSEIDIVGLAIDGLKRSIAADEAADTIATLTAERDDALGGYKAQVRRADEWRAHAEAAEARATRLEEALRGLVELKAMKGELLNLRSDPYYASQAAMLEVQYEQRKPLAWAKARTALAQEDKP
jgi:hypothetical protein